MFDDGTAMRSDSCPFMNSNVPGEIRLRFNTKYLKCLDNSESTTYDYICEYMYMYHTFLENENWPLLMRITIST